MTETRDEDFVTTKTGADGTISDNPSTAAFTNTRDEGGLIVSKSVLSDVNADHTKEFSFTVTLDDTTISGTYGDMTFENGVATFTLKDGMTKSATGLATGITYEVTEETDELFVTEKSGETGTIQENATTAAFTNTRKKGNLKVSKTVLSDAAADANKTFTFTVTLSESGISGTYGEMSFTDSVASVTLKDSESATATGLPADVNYTVTEADDNREMQGTAHVDRGTPGLK